MSSTAQQLQGIKRTHLQRHDLSVQSTALGLIREAGRLAGARDAADIRASASHAIW